MEFIRDKEKETAEQYIDEAKKLAHQATCQRAKCGALIVKDDKIIGRGFNSPAGNDEKERRCDIKKNSYDEKVTDKTCCVHAEQRAVMDALRHHPNQIKGSKLYFARFYPDGEQRVMGEKIQLYCTICTKMMYDVGIAKFILPHQNGICTYPMSEYLDRSFEYGQTKNE